MIQLGRRVLLGSALAVPAAQAMAQDLRMQHLRVSIAVDRMDEFLPLLRSFAASVPDLTVEAFVRDDNEGLVRPRGTAELRSGQWGSDVALADSFDLIWGATRGAWRPLPASIREAGAASAGPLSPLLQPHAGEEAMLVSADPGGPVLLHRPSILADPPRDAAALLDYARENRGRFFYARPSESVYGRLFLTVLPHLLGDRDPSDVQTGWTKTWAWLEELGRHVSYYPSNNEAAFEEIAAGDVHLFPASLTAFVRGRLDGVLAEEARFATLGNGPISPQGLFLVVPRFAAEAKLPVIERFARFLLRPETQSRFFGRGFLPGDLGFGLNEAAPRTDAERAALPGILPAAEAERVVALPRAPRLAPFQVAFMLNRWDEQIGARHGEGR